MHEQVFKTQGLTTVILDSLLDVSAYLAKQGEPVTPEVLNVVEHDLRRHLAPTDSQRGRLLFDMVFRRSFALARDILATSGRTVDRAAHAPIYSRQMAGTA